MIDIFNAFYRGKRVLVTGHTGFKGSWLSIWLHELGAEVIGVSRASYSGRGNYVLSSIGKRIKADLRGDIRDGEYLKQVFHEKLCGIYSHINAIDKKTAKKLSDITTFKLPVFKIWHSTGIFCSNRMLVRFLIFLSESIHNLKSNQPQ